MKERGLKGYIWYHIELYSIYDEGRRERERKRKTSYGKRKYIVYLCT